MNILVSASAWIYVSTATKEHKFGLAILVHLW
jgi:hypothetical protein